MLSSSFDDPLLLLLLAVAAAAGVSTDNIIGCHSCTIYYPEDIPKTVQSERFTAATPSARHQPSTWCGTPIRHRRGRCPSSAASALRAFCAPTTTKMARYRYNRTEGVNIRQRARRTLLVAALGRTAAPDPAATCEARTTREGGNWIAETRRDPRTGRPLPAGGFEEESGAAGEGKLAGTTDLLKLNLGDTQVSRIINGLVQVRATKEPLSQYCAGGTPACACDERGVRLGGRDQSLLTNGQSQISAAPFTPRKITETPTALRLLYIANFPPRKALL